MKPRLTNERRLVTMIATVLAMGTVWPCAIEAQAAMAFPVDRAEGPSLTVDVDPEMLQSEAHRGWVEARAREVLERRPRALEPDDHIEIGLAGTNRNYHLVVRVLRHGQPIAEQPDPIACKGSSDDLLVAVEAAVDDAVDRLIQAHKAEERAVVQAVLAAEEQAEREREARATTEKDRRRELAAKPYRPARLGLAGAVATGLGSALVVSGAILAARGRVDWGNDFIRDVDYRPPGYALLAVGSTVLATGITMLVVDVVRCERNREKCGERGRFSRRMAWGSRRAGVRW
jgi:hypothetical protein